jgi:hypothetical protein
VHHVTTHYVSHTNGAQDQIMSDIREQTQTWSEQLSPWTAKQIRAALGCGLTTAYQWKDGRNTPPAWQQGIYRAKLRRKFPRTTA